jgi:hypothetical protein
MKELWRNFGLSIVLTVLFLGCLTGQIFTGWYDHNNEQRDHHRPTDSLGKYLTTGDFWEATAENWESEFLQMGMYVILAAFLYQKGSSESKDPDNLPDPVDEDPALSKDNPNAPWPVRKGGWVMHLYGYSLSIAFLLLFAGSFLVHAIGGMKAHNQEQLQHGQAAMTLGQYMKSSRFWFESLQNWQSEFLAILSMVVLSIFLRQRCSPESKPVAAPHWEMPEDKPTKEYGEEELATRPFGGLASVRLETTEAEPAEAHLGQSEDVVLFHA